MIAVVTTLPSVFITAGVPYRLLDAGLFARGWGIGLSAMPAMTDAFRALEPAKVADATPQLNIVQRIGASMGTAIFAVVLQQGLDDAGVSPAGQADAFVWAFVWAFGVTVVAVFLAALLAVLERRERRARPS
ncbi:hypothetical protein J4573_35580 [Actinomadura barringtoniae]|uniref:MFS transporter n=1 Tax=Actinomadura barringtoniae TaxID=1427535 RepID=A0A939PHT4_9ACTN|nr:hypothetical protein [Actinomadura barringtoniae]MBO2452458.1 hypothetical protein [Actinomadura barringtoniae]